MPIATRMATAATTIPRHGSSLLVGADGAVVVACASMRTGAPAVTSSRGSPDAEGCHALRGGDVTDTLGAAVVLVPRAGTWVADTGAVSSRARTWVDGGASDVGSTVVDDPIGVVRSGRRPAGVTGSRTAAATGAASARGSAAGLSAGVSAATTGVVSGGASAGAAGSGAGGGAWWAGGCGCGAGCGAGAGSFAGGGGGAGAARGESKVSGSM